LTSQDGLRLLKAYGLNPDQIHCYNNHFLKRPQQIHRVQNFLENHQFDRVFCFEQKKRTLSWLPKHSIIIDDQHSDQHYAIRCLKLINPQPELVSAEPYLPTNEHDMLNPLKLHGVGSETKLIGIHPTYSGFNKWGRKEEKKHRLWPEQSFVELISILNRFGKEHQVDIRFIMDLLPEEQCIGERIKSICPDDLIVQCEPPNFQRYLAYLKCLDVLIAPNTGVMHLAAALNTPVVALFSGANPGDCGPYMHPERFRVVHSQNFQNSYLGMASIPVQPVVNAVISLLTNLELETA